MRALIIGVASVGVAGLVVLAACASTGARSARAARRLKEGDRVPDVAARNQDGVEVPLSRFRGHLLVLYFYPMDRTTGCTIEAHEFSAGYQKIREAGAEVVGVSNDSVGSHRKFCDSDELPFPLLADTDKTVAAAFGVGSWFGLYQRITFLIDGEGVIRKVFDPVKPAGHAAEVMAAVAALRSPPGG
jgi:thioredoxin-dependent peroxiredoxin